MQGFLHAIRSELYLAARSRGLLALLLLAPACGGLRILLAALAGASARARDALLGGKPVSAAVAGNAYGPFVDGMLAGLAIGALLLAALAAGILAARREQGTLRGVLILRSSRAAVVVAHFGFLLLAGLASIALLFLVSWGVAAWLHDFGPIVEDGYEILGTAALHDEIRMGLLLALAPLPAIIALGVVVALAARSAAESVGLTLGALLFLDFFEGLFGDAGLFLPTTYAPSLFDRSYLADVAKLARGYSDVLVDENVLWLNAAVPIPWTLLFLLVALAIAARRRF